MFVKGYFTSKNRGWRCGRVRRDTPGSVKDQFDSYQKMESKIDDMVYDITVGAGLIRSREKLM